MNFRTIHTAYGMRRIAQAEATGLPIKLTHMAVGDGGGREMQPDPEMTQLVREIANTRIAPNAVYQDPDDATKFSVELVIPSELGGFYMREVAIFDDAGGLFAIGNLPETYKPHKSEGAFGDATVRMDFMVTNADIVIIELDPNVALATRKWIGENITIAKLIPGGHTGQVLRKRTNVDGDVVWGDPGEFIVVVDTVEEQQTLAAGQVDVDLVETNTQGLAIYIDGERLPNMAGANGWLAHPIIDTRAILGKAYPAGSLLTAVQNEPASQLTGALQRGQNLADLENKENARVNLDVYSREQADRLAPVAEVAYFARTTAPNGWLKANGAAVSRTAYAALFEVIGTTYGPGDGLNTFNLPDLRGEFLRSWDDGRGVDANRDLGTAQASQNLAHSHTGNTDAGGSHTHSYVDGRPVNPPGSGSLQPGSGAKGIWEDTLMRTTGAAGSHTHSLTTTPSGGNEARPRNVALLTCIKY